VRIKDSETFANGTRIKEKFKSDKKGSVHHWNRRVAPNLSRFGGVVMLVVFALAHQLAVRARGGGESSPWPM